MSLKKCLRSGLAAAGLIHLLAVTTALAVPNIFIQPSSRTVLVGDTANFDATVTVSSGETITGFSWQFSTTGQNPFTQVATTQNLSIANAQTNNTGYYFLRVTYASGGNPGLVSVSTAVQLIVHDQARITVQPVGGLIRAVGDGATFTVTALGEAPLNYQWRYNGVNLADNARVSGANTPSLTVTNLLTTDSGGYQVIVSNQYASATSLVALLNVYIPPTVTVPPADTIVVRGSNVTLTAMVDGSLPITYRWRKNGTNLNEGVRFIGTTNSALTITGTVTGDTGDYSIFATNIVGNALSSTGRLTVVIPPTITSANIVTGRQGTNVNYTATATGTMPITWGADDLPLGLSIDPTNGMFLGIAEVSGVYTSTIYATNIGITIPKPIEITLTTGVPGINTSLMATGLQGQVFTYLIGASNDPTMFSAGSVPLGMGFNATNGAITGAPVVSGTFPIEIFAGNKYGGDTQTLALTILSGAPTVKAATDSTGTEGVAGFSYQIQANNVPYLFNAYGLPSGLNINTNTGLITGKPLYGGTNNVLITAANAWGVGSNILTLEIAFRQLTDSGTNGVIQLTDVMHAYSSPYLLDFTFTMRENLADPLDADPIIRPPGSFTVIPLEDNQQIGDETTFTVSRGDRKQLKTYLVLDYTFSMFDVPGAIDTMQESAKLLINQEPPSAQFGIYEFHADYVDPNKVTGFTANKMALSSAIDGIQNNFVQGNYAGTRFLDATYAAINEFTNTNPDEARYVIVMSDGNDYSSLLTTNADPIDTIVQLANTNQVRIFTIGFGPNINVANLQTLATNTLGRYYEAATTTDLADQFLRIVKEINGQYVIRWATLKRSSKQFQPAFFVQVDGFTNAFNTLVSNDIVTVIDTNLMTTNMVTNRITATEGPLYDPTMYAGDVRLGQMRLVADADDGPQTVRLRATYIPRFVRAMRIHYVPNYPCMPTLDSAGPGGLLQGWSMTETNDGMGGRWITLLSSNPTNLQSSLPYGAFGEILTFRFLHPEQLTAQQAFGRFDIDSTIYTNFLPSGISFTLTNGTNFVTTYTNAPPAHGTPIPWLISYGITNDFDNAELQDLNGNGLAVWQDYLAGLNPIDPNSRFDVIPFTEPVFNSHQLMFNTTVGRRYQVESSFDLYTWSVLRNNIDGTGGFILLNDTRDLSGVNRVYYRVAVY